MQLRRTTLIGLALLAGVACRGDARPRREERAGAGAARSVQAQRAVPDPQLADPCSAGSASRECSDSAERAVMATLPGWSRPSAAERVFVPASGSALRLHDDSSEGVGNARYRLLGRLPGTRYAVVARSGWESQDYLLVSEAGDTVAVEGRPLVAPDGQRIASASLDFEACYQSNSLEVWRLESRRPVREFGRRTGDCAKSSGWGPSDVVWRDSGTVEFTLSGPATESNGPRAAVRGRLSRSAAGWMLTAPSR